MSNVFGDSHRWGFLPNNFGLFRSHCYFGALYSIQFKEVVQKRKFSLPQYTKIYKKSINQCIMSIFD